MSLVISDWPMEERPREKLLDRGAAALSDAELLAIFLRTGTRGMTAVDAEQAKRIGLSPNGRRNRTKCRLRRNHSTWMS